MTCASCVALIESRLMQQTGVYSVAVGLLSERAEIEYSRTAISPETIVDIVKASIYVKGSEMNIN